MPTITTPAQLLASQALLPSELRTADWDALAITNPTTQAWINERAFFMAAVSQASILDSFRRNALDYTSGKIGPQEARKRLRAALATLGYQPTPPLNGTIKDLSSTARMKVTLETNLAQARGWSQYRTAMQNTSRPGFRLYRAGQAKAPRDWTTRWQQAWQSLTPQEQTTATSGQDPANLCALKTSPIWSRISRFGTPYPPFDFNSHMRTRSLSAAECQQLGILPQDPQALAALAQQQTASVPSLNANVEADISSLSASMVDQLEHILSGVATVRNHKLVMIDKNGTQECSWQEIGHVISAGHTPTQPQQKDNNKGRNQPKQQPTPGQLAWQQKQQDMAARLNNPDLQLNAFRLWIKDSSRFFIGNEQNRQLAQIHKAAVRAGMAKDYLPHPDYVSLDVIQDAQRLFTRIIPTSSDDAGKDPTIYRTLTFTSKTEGEKVLDLIKKKHDDGNSYYTARPNTLAESWSHSKRNAKNYARKDYSIILRCRSYKSRRRLDGIYDYLDKFPKEFPGFNMKSEAESIFLGNVRFIVDQIQETTVKDKKGRLKTIVYIDVREE